jgi:hypothetical protein
VWTLTDLSRPGSVAFFRAEVAPDVDERRAGLRECLERVSTRFHAALEAAARRGEGTPPLERVLDRVVTPLYFRVVFSIPETNEDYARGLVAELCDSGHATASTPVRTPARTRRRRSTSRAERLDHASVRLS